MNDPVFGNIPLAYVRASTTNPRKRFNQAALAELAASIKTHGVAQPILVRPVPDEEDHFEIVAGERRYRASQMAEQETIPAIVRNLTDVQALEIQLIENLQREDVHPIEEAEGYDKLMKDHAYTADQLAESVGKSRAYIYGRLKLCALCEAARVAFYDDKLNPSTALLIARIPVPSLQEKATQEITHEYGTDVPMSVRRASAHIQSRYMLDLADAKFNIADAKLVKVAGACTSCPKRTGAQPEIFRDIDDADVCTDPDCFASKRKVHNEKLVAMVIKKGIPIHEQSDAHDAAEDNDLAFFPRLHEFERITPGQNDSASVLSLLPKELLPEPKAYAKWNGDEIVPMFDKNAMQEALEKAGLCETLQQHTARMHEKIDGNQSDPEPNEATKKFAERSARAAEETKVREEIYNQIRHTSKNGVAMELDVIRAIAKFMLVEYVLPSDRIEYPFITTEESIREHIDQATAAEILILMMDMMVSPVTQVNSYELEQDGTVDEEDQGYQDLLELGRHCFVDIDQIRDDLTPKLEDEIKPTKATKAKKAKSPNPATAWPFPEGARP